MPVGSGTGVEETFGMVTSPRPNHAEHERLAILVPSLVYGGAQRSMIKLAAGIRERGYTVDLVLAQATGPLLSEVPPYIRVVDLKAPRALASLPALIHYLQKERPFTLLSVLHTNLIALWARALSGVPVRVVLSERNNLSSEAGHYRSDLRFRLMPGLMKTFYRSAEAVVAVSKGVAEDLIRTASIPPDKVRVIYNPIITPEFREKMDAHLEHPWLQDGEPPVLLAVGRLTTQKDFATLIRAFAQVWRTRKARLMILGEGEERQALEALIATLGLAQSVSMPGFISNPYPYMKRAAAFVLSSRWEGLPGVLIEALYSGIPLIATDCPSGPYEILAGGKYGQLVPVGDVAGLANAMELAIEGKISRPAEESVLRFELESVVDQYLELLFNHPASQPLLA